MKNDVHYSGIRIEKETVEKVDSLIRFLEENDLILIHGKSHIEIKKRNGLEPIGTAFIL